VTTADEGSGEIATWDAVAADFDTFFANNYAELVRALAVALGDVEFGRDAASEGFTRALQRWSSVSQFSNPAGWVYRVGLNWAHSRWRKSRRERTGLLVDTAAPAVAGVDASLVVALQQLSLDHRSVVVGRYYFDWSEAQLAAALDIAPGTVKSRLSRALTQLAQLLEDGHGQS
jgi:RNA polymerase sigma-70 factor (ECF subfamily)